VIDWTVNPEAPVPPSRQLVDAVLDGVARQALTSGDRLPSVRGLAAEARVNHNTVARAYRDLESLGVLRGENGRGCFVTKAALAVARRERSAATLSAFREALSAALRAGHSIEQLEAEFRHLDEESA